MGAEMNGHKQGCECVEFAMNMGSDVECTTDCLSCTCKRKSAPLPPEKATTPGSRGCQARGHVWNNYNAEYDRECIVCGAKPESLAAPEKAVGLPPLDVTDEDCKKAWDSCMPDHGEYISPGALRASYFCRERQLLALLNAPAEAWPDAEVFELRTKLTESVCGEQDLRIANRKLEGELSEAKASHGKTLLLLNKAAFETIPQLEAKLKPAEPPQAVGGWIRIEEGCEMPNSAEEVLVRSRTGYCTTLEYVGAGRWAQAEEEHDGYWDRFITHWARIVPPSLPTETK